MKDVTGREIKVGDTVIYAEGYGSSGARLRLREVSKINPQSVTTVHEYVNWRGEKKVAKSVIRNGDRVFILNEFDDTKIREKLAELEEWEDL